MIIMTIFYSVLLAVTVVGAVVFCFLYDSLPQVFNRSQYEEWKLVMSFKYPVFSEKVSYEKEGIEWHVNIRFEDNPDYTCTIFNLNGKTYVLLYKNDVVVFSSFWKKHAQKTIDRFMPEIENMQIVHL